MKKIFFYCQNLLGIGHLTRSWAISSELVKQFEVHFVQGGPDIQRKNAHPNFHRHQLQPLLMRENDSSLFDPENQRTVEEIWKLRAEQLSRILEEPFDVCLIELFPFGRKKFRREIAFILSKLRQSNSKALVFCSLRDILVESQGSDSRMLETIQFVQTETNAVLVHSDPTIFPLDLTFSKAKEISSKICYTGFVCETRAKPFAGKRDRKILVSIGGGSVGGEVLEATLAVVSHFPGYQFVFVPGPFSPPHLKEMIERNPAPNVQHVPFLEDFESVLSQCQLSISLAGYNTVMNLLHTKTRGLVFPYLANQEQTMRAEKFTEMGFMEIIRLQDLDPKILTEKIQKNLDLPFPETTIDLDGAQKTCEAILHWHE